MLADALTAGQDRDYQRAAEILLTLVSETDEYPRAYLYLGRSFHAIGRFERAIQFLHYFTQLAPDIGAGHFFLGRAYFAAGLYAEAGRCLERANRLDPHNPQILGLLGITYLKRRRSEIAVELLGNAVEADPDNSVLYSGYLNTLTVEAIRRFRKGDVDMSRQMLEFLVGHGASNTLTDLYLASCYKELGRYEEALERYDRVIEREPSDPVLRLQRADVLLRLGLADHAREVVSEYEAKPESMDPEALVRHMAIESFQQGRFLKAIEFAKKVIKARGSDFEMHMLLGDAFRHSGSLEKAVNHFRRALQFERTRVEPRYGLILSFWQLEQFDNLVSEARSVLRIDPTDPIASYYSALGKCRLGYPTAEMIPLLERELSASGADPFICTSLGAQHLAAGAPDRAERYFRMALDLSESHRAAYEGLFRIYDRADKAEAAEEIYNAYLDRFPDDHERRRDYIRLLVGLRRYERAAEEIVRRLPHDRSSIALRRLLAYCYRETGRYRDAAVVYRRLLKENPDSEFYLRALCYCLDRSGNRDAAIQLLDRAFAYRPPTVAMRLIRGVLLFREKRVDEALDAFRAVLDESQGDWRPYRNIAAIYRHRGMQEMADRFEERARALYTGP